ncbi:hypothetical protein [Nocardia gamkensis]|uniref:hypothetical protein n=1 Tax=Nocardia gamkensis TaxID=352869 RepID=UPI0037C81E36
MRIQNLLSAGRGATAAATLAAVAVALVVQAPSAQARETASALGCDARFNHNPMLINGGVGVGAQVTCDIKPTSVRVMLLLEHRTRDGKWVDMHSDHSSEIPNVWHNVVAYYAHCDDGAWRAKVTIDVKSGGKEASDSAETSPTIINCNP